MSTESDKKSAPMLPQEMRAVAVVSSVAMLRMIGLFSLLPVLSLYAGQLPGHRPILVGLAVGAYGLTQAALQIPLGALSDRIGRVPIIVGGLIVFAAGSVLAATGDTIWTVIAGRLLQGAGAIAATLYALIADSTREAVRTRSMAIYGGVGYGVSIFIALGAGPSVAAHFGVPVLFWVGGVAAIVAILLLLALPGSAARPLKPQSWDFAPAFKSKLLRLDAYMFLLQVIQIATMVALPYLLTRKLQLSVAQFGEFFLGALLASLVVAVPLIRSDERQGKPRTIEIAVALMLAGQVMLWLLGISLVSIFIALTVFLAGFVFLEAGLPARLTLLADDDARGSSLGVFSTSQFFGAFVGGLLGGRFLAGGDPADVFRVCALLAALWLIAGIRLNDS
jgi:MFS family permease